MQPAVYRCAGIFRQGRFETSAQLCVDAHGQVVASPIAGSVHHEWPNRWLLPGLVNAHSHAFQRVLRGRTEHLSAGHPHDDFWSWRELMYRAANALSPEGVYTASRQAFVEMALAGITTVGEFHYLHHQPDGQPYDDVHLLARQVVQAAKDVGLRIALLRVGYARAGFQVPPNPLQKRFIEPDVETFYSRVQSLQMLFAGQPQLSVGMAPHSVRAVPIDWLRFLGAVKHDTVMHLHVAEQPKEIEACLAEHRQRPVELLSDNGMLHPRTTAVHAIHLSENEVKLLGASGASVCACPSTERNLGDGVVPADVLMRSGVPVALGSDSQAHIDLLDEARQLEGHLRLVRGRRVVLAQGDAGPDALGVSLLRSATEMGARSLGLATGTLQPGEPADFCTLDIEHASLRGLPFQHGASSAALFGSAAAVREVAVQGELIVRDGQHALAASAAVDYHALIKELLA
ncbi:MAG: formimidoylglutamate deiminase [Myxococcaceae bacterium]|nr:formimidoylglutamate deiminase [Myxococcaceae bacterium]